MNTCPHLRDLLVIVLGTYLSFCQATVAQEVSGSPLFPASSLDTQIDIGLAIPESDEGIAGEGPLRRADWFKNLWTGRRTLWSQRIQEDQNAIVFLGDSITQGWGDDFQHAFPGMKVANRGISGDTTRGMLVRVDNDVIALNPQAVVMLMGTNDLEEAAEAAVIGNNVTAIISRLKAHNAKMPIVLCLVMPSSESKRRPSAAIKEINKTLSAIAKGDPQIIVLDTWTLFANADGDAKLEEFPDLLHPNHVGYAKWAAALRPLFATLGFIETEADKFEMEPGFESLFNGTDLSGWGFRLGYLDKNKPTGTLPSSSLIDFNGQTASPDGRYVAINGRLVVTTPPEGRRIQQLWTTEEFGDDFELRLEFRATPNADSGVFIRKPQLQCRDYSLAGPYNNLSSYKPQDWNEIAVTVHGGKAYCTCNGEVLEESLDVPAIGPIGLEGDRGQMEYRRIRIKRL